MQYVRAQKNKKNIRRILKSVENKWECASINGTVDRCVRAVCGCAVYILSSVVFRLYSRFELTVLLETCSPTGFSTCLHGY